MEHYVYELLNPIDNKIFYVGKGSNNRMYIHEYRAKRPNAEINENIRLRNKIKSILNIGDKVKYKKIFITNNAKQAYEMETKRILEIGLENLCNRFIFPPSSEEIYKIISMRLRGHKTSDGTKEKIRQSLMGHPVSLKTRKKISQSQIGKKRPCSERRKQKIAESRRPKNGFPALISPDGEIFHINILSDFCREHNLHLPAMCGLIKKYKNAKSHRGWKLKGE